MRPSPAAAADLLFPSLPSEGGQPCRVPGQPWCGRTQTLQSLRLLSVQWGRVMLVSLTFVLSLIHWLIESLGIV